MEVGISAVSVLVSTRSSHSLLTQTEERKEIKGKKGRKTHPSMLMSFRSPPKYRA